MKEFTKQVYTMKRSFKKGHSRCVLDVCGVKSVKFNPLSAIGKYTYQWKFDLFMVLDP